MRETGRILCAAFIFFSLMAAAVEGADKIQDNSFLLEEAYNQEDGVIQHIFTYQYLKKARTWGLTFTQEWPVPGQTHQLSYTIPFGRVSDPEWKTGIGDTALNYRYQLVFKEAVALSPRFSLLLPTGDYKKGLGTGALGFQTNIPLSVELSDKWVTHWNMGLTFTPGSKEEGGAKSDTVGTNFGASFIYLATKNFNLMLESVWNSTETVQADGSKVREDAFFVNPGMRYAVDFKSGLQVVPGIAVPIGLGPSSGEHGVFLYISFEHPLF
ncbi:MAG: transporter [Deltaproteobacteria bacterium]|nr:transporter [Deltaproteobacteria bacterium]